MKKTWNIISNVLVWLVTAVAVCMMIFTVTSVSVFDQQNRSLFGYRMMVVLSDSMSATDFGAGDLIFVKKNIDPKSLEAGDIISYISQDSANKGQTVTHKIRKVVQDKEGNIGFVTYGTTTGIDDSVVVTEQFILGEYRGKLPGVGRFFAYLRTVPGYLLFVLLPFGLVIIWQGINSVRTFRELKAVDREEIESERQELNSEREELDSERQELINERERLRQEREENQRMLEKLESLKTQLTAEENERSVSES